MRRETSSERVSRGEAKPLLCVAGLAKSFGRLPVLSDVTFSIDPGEIVGLVGPNGSGKSVLLRILAGLLKPDRGEVTFNRHRVRWPFSAPRLGIAYVPESPMLAEELDVTANIFLGHEIGWSLGLSWVRIPNRHAMDVRAQEALRRLEAVIPSLREQAAYLSPEQRQLVSIARVLVGQPRLVLLDDPFPLLSTPYQKRLLDLVEEWRTQGTAVLLVSNNLDHLFAVTDRILVLREGRIVRDVNTDATTWEEVVHAIVGTWHAQHVTPLIWALDSYHQAKEQAEKLRHQQRLLERDLAAQATIQRQLLEQLNRQIVALDQANRALQEAQRRLLKEREEERKHLARELHDEVIQDLLSINYQLEVLADGQLQPDEVRNALQDVREDIRNLIAEVRRICKDLRPPTIDSFGLAAAIRSYVQEWEKRTGIRVYLEIEQNLGRLPEAIELSLFRIVQEGLNNVWKHAHATQVALSVRHSSPRKISITIADNGRGLPPDFDLAAAARSGHFGLVSIGERVALLGGRLTLKNRPEGGLEIHVEVPHPRPLRHDGSGADELSVARETAAG